MHFPRKILVIYDDETGVERLSDILRGNGSYEVLAVQNTAEGLQTAVYEQPDLIILDLTLPPIEGYETCHILRTSTATHHSLIVMLSAQSSVESQVQGLASGADSVIAKPFDQALFLVCIETMLRRQEASLDANPLTRLPGNTSIARELERCLQSPDPFAVGYVDLDNFKALNDRYGFVIGDQVIVETGRIISQAVTPCDFVGHIGGDDFVVITVPERVESICRTVIAEFDRIAPHYYEAADRSQGYIVCRSRRGAIRRFPLITMSIAVVTNLEHHFRHIAEIGTIAAELKHYLKTLPGSNYLVDRRKPGDIVQE